MNQQFALSRGRQGDNPVPFTTRLPVMVLVGIATMIGGCKVGPDYCGAPAPIDERWLDADVDPRICGQPEDMTQWWNQFNDSTLTSLISTVGRQNPTLRSASFQIQAARSARGIAAGSLFPQSQTANGNFTRVNNSQSTALAPPIADFDNWGLTVFDAQWELDFWGKFRRNIEGADGDLQASIATYDDILVSLQGETAAAYIQLRTLQRRLELTLNNVEIQKGSLGIATAQFDSGAVSELDVTQAKQSLAQTTSAVPSLEAGIRSTKNALCVLLGTTPGELDFLLDESAAIPVPPESICVGVPSELLQRRPDIRAAWHTAAAQSASIGVAITDLYPSFIIAGDIGNQSENLSRLFTSRSVVGAVGPAFNWKILNYGRIKNNVRLQEDLLQSQLANYQQTVLSAYQEVENGLINYTRTFDQLEQLTIAAEQAEKSVKLATVQYQNGAIDFNRVFTLQLDLVGAQDALAASQGNLATQLVSVYKALGGGWRARMTGYSMPAGPMAMQPIDLEQPPAAEKEPLPEPPAADDDAKDAEAGILFDLSTPSTAAADAPTESPVATVEPIVAISPRLHDDGHRTKKREFFPRFANRSNDDRKAGKDD